MVYAIYMMNLRSAWTVAGTPDGAGSTQFTSYGAGAEISLPVYNIDIMRMNFAINGEYVRQKARLTFIPTSGGTDILDLSTTSYLVGVGFEPELWLGDMYALSLFAGYQYGLNQTWQVAKDATFMNNPFVVGALTNPTSGSGLTSQFGGFYLAAGLKLHFQ